MNPQVALDIWRQDLRERHFDMLAVLGLLGLEAQPVDAIDTNDMTTDLDRREVLEAHWPGRKERDDQSAAELNFDRKRIVPGGHTYSRVHEIETEIEELR